MKLKTNIAAALMPLIFPVAVYANPFAGIYEKTGLIQTQVVEKPDCIEITGSTGQSGSTVSKVTTKKDKHDLVVTVHWILCGVPHPLARKNSLGHGVQLSGLDHYRVPITPDINRVLMGTERVVIWQRGGDKLSSPTTMQP